MAYRLGIDAGSKTIKLVLLDERGALVFSQYALHRSDIVTTMKTVLHNTIWRFGDAEVTVCVTGSAGMRLAELLDAPHVQEVIATRHALGVLIPEADVAIELGGEDAKVIYLSGGVEQRMNGTCAGGTGGFIDLMCGMLGVRARQFNTMALGHQTIYPIASRCAVFAQTDVRPLLNEGARRGDIAASILQAVVTQTIAGLSCGRPITGTVVFLGGPFEVYSELVSRFRQTLGLSFSQTIKPADAHLFVAKGAALLSADGSAGLASSATLTDSALPATPAAPVTPTAPVASPRTLQSLHDILEAAPVETDGGINRLRPLFASEEELAEFKRRHEQDKVRRARLMDTTGDVFIGIDAGSTTVKLAAVNTAGELLYSDYEKSNGDVLETTREMLGGFYDALPHEYGGDSLVNIRQVKVTGYGEGFLQAALNADSGVVETIAHLRAARQFRPELDFVLDIGGQDIKCMRVRDGAVDDIMLNESCSSGCGALIEGFSRSLGFTKWSFASCALEAARPADLGTRCTVFMTSRVRHAQKEGVSAADIAAGLAYSVVRNALYKVIGCTDPSTLGEHVVVQGGTFKSDAVLRAFELESGLEVVRPDIAELMGAYGAALLARDECAAEDSDDLHLGSTLLTPLELASLSRQQTARRCQGCVNNCLLTLNTFVSSEAVECAAGAPLAARAGQAERSFVTGNRCERAVAGAGMSRSQPNLFEYERRLLFAYDRRSEEAKSSACGLTIGIPGVLDLYETYPFWWAFFTELGLNVIRIPASRSDVYRKGAHAVMSEGVCYPAKLAHGHVLHLIERGADLIFMPTGGAVASSRKGVCEAGCSRMIECPVSSNYARIVAEGVAELDAPVRFLTCDLGSTVPLARQLREALENAGLAASLCLDDERLHQAFAAATREQGVFYERLADQSAEVLRGLDENDTRGIVLAGHPYHVDAGISHGVDSLLAGLGFPVLSAAGLLALRHRGGFPTAAGAASGEGNCRAHALGGPELPVSDCPDITGARGVSAAALAPVDVDAIAATWTQPAALYELARMVAGRERLDLVQLYSFGCGVDALSTGQVRAILEDAGKLYTALKMDEMVDLAAIRIRLRSLIAALQARRQRPSLRRSTPDCVKSPPSVIAPLVIMPALMPQHLAAVRRVVGEAGYRLEILPELSVDDVETGLRFCSNDLCHPLIALAGQVIGVLRDREETGPVTVMIPQVCYGCRAIELEHIIRGQLKGIPGSDDIGITGIPSRNELFTMPAWLATRIYDELAQVDAASASATAPTASVAAAPAASAAASAAVPTASAAAPATTAPASTAAPAASTTAPATTAPASTTSATAPATTAPASTTSATAPATVGSALTPVPQPRVGVVGNAGLLFTPRLNRDLLKRIEAQGCVPHTPPITELLTTNAPLERFVDSFVEQGILDIICVQSFGCLTGHIHGRGAAKRLKERHPELNVSFIDYDSGTSEVNQDNRLRLALTIARERTPTP